MLSLKTLILIEAVVAVVVLGVVALIITCNIKKKKAKDKENA